MARILFTVPPLTGHLNPALAVAAVLAAQGHVIAWAVHARQIGDRLPAGATVFPLDIPGAFDGAGCVADVRGFESVRLFFEDYTIPLAQASLTPLEAAVTAFRPDIMVVDHQMVAGALVARKTGVSWVTLVTTTASILKMPAVLEDWLAAQLRTLQQTYLPAAATVARPTFSPLANIVFSVEAFVGAAHERVEAPYVFVGPAQGQGRQPVDFPWQWLQAGKHRILVTMGTVSRDRDTRFFEVVMAALAGMDDVQAVLVAPPSLAAQAPANVLVRSYVPQLELLDHMDGVICHAGHNTVCEALARGVPLIVAPIRDDQPIIARQVMDAGAGLFMRHGKVTPAAAATAIRRLLDDSTLRDHARHLAAVFAGTASAETAAACIVSLARPATAIGTAAEATASETAVSETAVSEATSAEATTAAGGR